VVGANTKAVPENGPSLGGCDSGLPRVDHAVSRLSPRRNGLNYRMTFRQLTGFLLGWALLAAPATAGAQTNLLASPRSGKVYIIPIREDIMPRWFTLSGVGLRKPWRPTRTP